MILDGKTVLVTGGGRGLGKDMALLFAECGADVMIAGRGISHLEKTVSEIRSTGAGGEYCVCDVSRSDDVEALVKAAAAFGKGKLDIVVHAAGVQSIDDLLLTTDEEIAKVMAVNVGGTANIIKHALPVLQKDILWACAEAVRPGGLLVINSSIIDRKAVRDDIDVIYCDAQHIAEAVGNPKGANVAILGAMMEKCDIVDTDRMIEAIRIELGERKAKFLEGNKKALLAGKEMAKERWKEL